VTKNWNLFPNEQPYGEDLANFSCYRLYEKSAIAGYGVLSGCVVSRSSASAVAVASGTFTVAGVKKTFAGGSLTSISAAAAGKHRYDLVYIDGADDTLKLAAGTEDTPTSATDFLENYVPRPAAPSDTDWVCLAVIRVTESGIENTSFGTNSYATGSVANMRLGPIFGVDDTTLQVVDGVASVKTAYVKADGTVPLTANWDVGAYKITANQLESDVAAGTPPLVVASDTVIPNLNASKLEGNAASAFAVAAKGVTNGDSHDHSGGDGAQIDHGNLGGLTDDDHSQYIKHSLATAENDLLVASGSGAFIKKTLNETKTILGFGYPGLYQQAIINGGFIVNQYAVSTYTSATTPANSDDTYLHDQWILLSDGNDVVDVYAATSPNIPHSRVQFEVETANKKFGYLQIIENKDAYQFYGKTVSLQFKAATIAGKVIKNVRAAVLSWSSTADSVTSDVVASWGAEGNNPTWATNWTAENTATNLALVEGTWTTYKIENISVDTASMTNLAVFIWVDDTDAAVDDLFYLSDVQLNEGAVCTAYMPMRYEDEVARCSYPLDWTPTGSWTSNTTYTGKWQRIGNKAYYEVRVATSGAPNSADLTINLPHTIDITQLLESTSQQSVFGVGDILDTGTNRFLCVAKYNDTTSVIICASAGPYTVPKVPVTQAVPMTWANGDVLIIRFNVPVVGWSKKRL